MIAPYKEISILLNIGIFRGTDVKGIYATLSLQGLH